MSRAWHPVDYALKYYVGDRIVARRKLRLEAMDVGLESARNASLHLEPPARDLAPGLDGFLVRSLPVGAPPPTFGRSGQYLVYVSSRYQRFYIDLDEDFGQYLGHFSSKTRSGLKRKVNRLAKYCGRAIDFRVYRSAGEMERFFAVARQVSERSYQERLLDVGMPSEAGFLDHMRQLAAGDEVRGYVVFVGDQPASYLYLEAEGRTLLYRYLGFDPAFADLSVGTVLHWCALEHLFAERCFGLLDFTEGEGPQKAQFSTGSVACVNALFLRDSLRNRVLVRSHAWFNAMTERAGALAARLGIKATLRRLLRGGAGRVQRGSAAGEPE
jgi:CelD/BcsL family acetyltransferase involved in cellulose biosynthesis